MALGNLPHSIWNSTMADEDSLESKSSRNIKLLKFVGLVNHGDPIPPELLAFIAEGVMRYVEGSTTPWRSRRGQSPFAPDRDYGIWCDYYFRYTHLSRGKAGTKAPFLESKYPIKSEAIVKVASRVQKHLSTEWDNKWTELYLAISMSEEDFALAKASNFGRKPQG